MVSIVDEYETKTKRSPIFDNNQEARDFLDNLSLMAKTLKSENNLKSFLEAKAIMVRNFHRAVGILSTDRDMLEKAMHKRLIFVNKIDDVWEKARLNNLHNAKMEESWKNSQEERKSQWQKEYVIEQLCPECNGIIKFPESNMDDRKQQVVFDNVYVPLWTDLATGKIKFCQHCEAKANKDGKWRKAKIKQVFSEYINEVKAQKDLKRLMGFEVKDSMTIGYSFDEFCNEFLWYSRDKKNVSIPKAKQVVNDIFDGNVKFHDPEANVFVSEFKT